MSTSITWKVTNLDLYPTYNNYTDVVFNIHWDCLGQREHSGSTYTSRIYGVNDVTFSSGSVFIPYEQLTENDVLEWLWNNMGSGSKQQFENDAAVKIDEQISPTVVTLPLPWT